MFSKKPQEVAFRNQIDAALDADADYPELLKRRANVGTEIKNGEDELADLLGRVAATPDPKNEAAAIASGVASASGVIDRATYREEIQAVNSRLVVLRDAAGQIDTQIRDRKNEIGKGIYETGIREEQLAAAEKTVDFLLDMGALRVEEHRRLMEVQTAGINVLAMPRIAIRVITAAFVDEYFRNQLQPIGYKLSDAQAARLAGLKQAEARGA
ncbi:MAG: hypothetical protein FIA96_11185 [Betaproteobacteria bacterium]|nr:hypothetical protein [Betaproteobacteria bacterium]